MELRSNDTVLGGVDSDRIKAQMRRWQDRVLDLTKSNPLIGLNRSRVAKLPVIAPDADSLFFRFVLNEERLRMPLVRKRKHRQEHQLLDVIEEEFDFVIETGDITLDVKPIDLMRRLRRIYANSRTTIEERGVTTLYLTFGALHWLDDLLGESLSPLCMVPCEFQSKGPDAPLRLCMADEDVQINPALEYYLRERHKIQLPEIPDEIDQQSLMTLLLSIRESTREQPWTVTEEVWLSTFSFESLVIYRDLQVLATAATAHPITAALSGATRSAGQSESLPHNLDTLPTPATVPIPALPTDSSQLEALILSSLGQHVVVHGPPGTGKSQTISNLIADALARNKKVLFVSAKMAALNVVYERLKELGLQRFCLEAHSTKAGKQKVIDELRRTLEAEGHHDGDAIEKSIQELLRVREDLNSYCRELHAPVKPLGLSIYQANAKLAHLLRFPDVRGALPWSIPLDASQDDLTECEHALEELAANSIVFDQRATHPWRGFSPKQFGLSDQESLDACLRQVVDLYTEIGPLAKQLEALFPDACSFSMKSWILLRAAMEKITETERLPRDWWQQSQETLARFSKLFATAANQWKEMNSLFSEIRNVIDGSPTDLETLLSPMRDRYGDWLAFLKPSYWQWRKKVQLSLKAGVKFNKRQIQFIHSQCCRAREIATWFNEHSATVKMYLEPFGDSRFETFNAVSHSFNLASLMKMGLTAVDKQAPQVLILSAALRNSAESLLHLIPDKDMPLPPAIQRINIDWPNGFIREMSASESPLDDVADRVVSLVASMHKAREWVLLDRALKSCTACSLSKFIESFGSVSASDAPKIFERRFFNLWISSVLDRNQVLSGFTETRGLDLINKYRSLDDRVRRLAIARAQAVASSASARIRGAENISDTASEVGILRRELQKQKRIKPLRKLFSEIPHVLQTLKPCLLMSPISVSTYLKPDSFHFDLVVFDEASQLPTPEAVPSILRATQVVVAGDPKQLPPTSFFESSLIPEEEDDENGAEGQIPLDSLLDDCVAIVPVFREAYLRWHYRSRDERLIKFSNHFFYDNRLITFPGSNPAAAGQGVRCEYVPGGVYDRGRSRTNRIEAGTVARLAIEHFDRCPERSLGIVALNLSQKEAIEDVIAEILPSRPDLETFFDRARDESVFVKSLENVQGDERDTMIISVGYERDRDGGLSMNFGPINTDGGWRRLNVLVTRARWECILVSSLRSTDLSGVNPNNRGALSLRNFLEYAERNCDLPSDIPVKTDSETNEFEEAVCAALVDRGFKVDMQVGASRYRIDLAVRDPHDERHYVLGVECDGVTYHSSRTARDRDLLRQLVLQRMGWRIHRLWSTEWFHDPEKAISGILRSIEQAQNFPSAKPVPAPPASDTATPLQGPTNKVRPKHADVIRRYKAGVPYSLFRPSCEAKREHLLDRRYSNVLSNTISALVKVEGPIHYDVLVERLKAIHDIAKVGSNIQTNIKKALSAAKRRGTIAVSTKHNSFYYSADTKLSTFRLPNDIIKRPVEYIAPEELSLVVLYLVEDQFGVVEESLPTVVARHIGIRVLRKESADIIADVINDLVKQGLLRRSGSQVHLC